VTPVTTLHLLIFQQFVVIFEGEFYFSQNLSYQGARENYTFVMWNGGGSSSGCLKRAWLPFWRVFSKPN
jgi:hypothetical protein